MTNLTSQDILNTLENNQALLLKYKVKKIGLFGSYASGEANENSDIDFMV